MHGGELALKLDWRATGDEFWVRGSDLNIRLQLSNSQSLLSNLKAEKFQREEAYSDTVQAMLARTAETALLQAKSAGDLIVELGTLATGIKFAKKGVVLLNDLISGFQDITGLLKGFEAPLEKPGDLLNNVLKVLTRIGDGLEKIAYRLGPIAGVTAAIYELQSEFNKYDQDMAAYYQSLTSQETTIFNLGGRIETLEQVIATAEKYLAEHSSDLSIVNGGDIEVLIGEDMAPPSGSLSEIGFIKFADANLTDTHVVDVTHDPSLLGRVTASVVMESLGGTGTVRWKYAVDAAAVEYLALGQEIKEQFTLTIRDNNGGAATINVTAVVRGTNDRPVIDLTGDFSGTVSAADSTDNGSFMFSDVDLSDTHELSYSFVGQGSPLGTFQATELNGLVTWTYEVGASAFNSLTADRLETFDVTVTDGAGSSVTQSVQVVLDHAASTPDPDEPPPTGRTYNLTILTDPVFFDTDGDGQSDTFEYVGFAEYTTSNLGAALQTTYRHRYGGEEDDDDFYVYGPDVTFNGLTAPSWEISGSQSWQPEEGAQVLVDADDSFEIAEAESDAPVIGWLYKIYIQDVFYSVHTNGTATTADDSLVSTYKYMTFYTSSLGNIFAEQSPVYGPDVSIPYRGSTFTYKSWEAGWDFNWYDEPPYEVPAGATLLNTADAILGYV